MAKIYKPNKVSVAREKKLRRMISSPPNSSVLNEVTWPQDVLYDASSGQFAGFVMRRLNANINQELNVIYEFGAGSKYPHMPWEQKIKIASDICYVLACIHRASHVCGDLNPKDIFVDPNNAVVTFIDTDSYHITDNGNIYRCEVGVPEYLPYEIQVKMRGGNNLSSAALPTFTQDTDNFALAVHIFQLLMNGTHPFSCRIVARQSSVVAPQPIDNIMKGEFPFIAASSGTAIPKFAPPLSILTSELQNLFKRAFIDGYRNPAARPTPKEWQNALLSMKGQLIKCSCERHHQYLNTLQSCPWCDVNNAMKGNFKSNHHANQYLPAPNNRTASPTVRQMVQPTFRPQLPPTYPAATPCANTVVNRTSSGKIITQQFSTHPNISQQWESMKKKAFNIGFKALSFVLVIFLIHGIFTHSPTINEENEQISLLTQNATTILTHGTLSGTNDAGVTWTYVGDLISTRQFGRRCQCRTPYGYGKMDWSDGSSYEGNWVNGHQSGYGEFTWADGSVYVGNFFNGQLHGNGRLLYSNGIIQEGNWVNSVLVNI